MHNNPKSPPSNIAILLWKWWRGMDQSLIISVGILVIFSSILVTTASSAVAARIGLPESYFASRHLINIALFVIGMLAISSLNLKWLKRLAILGFIINLGLLVLVKFYGVEVKGARRWINFIGFSLQPSEFIKPFFALLTGIIFSAFHSRYISFLVSLGCYMIVFLLLVIQPDIGMLVTITGICGLQLFIAGLPILWMFVALIFGVLLLFILYKVLPHVADRIDSFLNPSNYENYQVSKSLLAFKEGSWFGKGPGEGVVKQVLPDSHTDFIFAVTGEEFGVFGCVLVAGILGFIVIRGFIKLRQEKDEFILLSSSGILGQIGLQSAINMGVSLNLLPTKGMTLPFLSYGGSSTLAVGMAMGILLVLSRYRARDINFHLKKVD